MAIDPNKWITFQDHPQLLTEGFTEKSGHGYNLSSNELVIKSQAEAIWNLNTTHADWISLAANQWVARWRMIPTGNLPTGYNLMGLVSVTATDENSISIQWDDPG